MREARDYTLLPDRVLQGGLREALRRQLLRWFVDDRIAARFVLVVDELVGNSIDHGATYRVPDHRLSVRMVLEHGDLRLRFTDPDVPVALMNAVKAQLDIATAPPPLDSERGRGLFLIRDTLDEVEVRALSAESVGMEVIGRILDVQS